MVRIAAIRPGPRAADGGPIGNLAISLARLLRGPVQKW